MKNFIIVASFSVLLAVHAVAQVGLSDGLSIGPNIVRIEARHCQAYRTYPGWLGRHLFGRRAHLDPRGSARCSVDPTTVYQSVETHNLKTNAGLDFIFGQISGTASASTAQWIALSTSGSAVSVTDTSLPSEISTNGLGRAQGTYAHTASTSTYTLTEIFTATGAQSGIAKVGVLTAVSVGTLVYELLLGTPISMNSGDQLSVQWTVTGS